MEKEFLLKEKYAGTKTPEYEADVARLDAGEPLAYVIGFVPFLDCKIFLDSRPLIPRTETEFWVEVVLGKLKAESSQLKAIQKPLRFLDLFAGSGCIGVAVLKHIQNAHVDFGEIDTHHFPTIEKNVRENGINEARTKIVHTDVWNGIDASYDYVFANPPYLSENRTERIEKSVLEHEPREALFADENGFALIRKLIEGADAHLTPEGALYIEHEPEHTEILKKYAEECGFRAETKKDQYGVFRYSIIRKL